ncbi:hypothetical protein R1sor_003706 [Riccia sorocarpa]|uniref:Uncharacterized protein n=1 Tax=Riccia sorocarpa TaxID=122646 RepID=A0ABD3H8J1_9MARC
MTEPSVRPMPKEKGKSPAYKLQSDVETSVNMRELIDKRILNTKIEISLKELMGLAKKEVHDILVDGVKRKRQIAGETANIQTLEGVTLDEEKNYDVASVCNIPAVKSQELHVRWADEAKDEGELPISHYTVNHWASGTTETLVRVGDLEDPVVALIDHGSEINVMAKSLHEKGKWPIDFEHGWMVRTANNSRGGLHRACPSVDIQIGGIKVEQRVFVQERASFPIILGQPFITAVRMETKVLDDGSAYARIRSRDNKNTVQFLSVPVNHERNHEEVDGVYEESGLGDTLADFEEIGNENEDRVVQVHSKELYSVLESFRAIEVLVETKYKTVAKKVKPVAIPLPGDSREQIERVSREKSLKDRRKGGHTFTEKTLDELGIGTDGTLLQAEKMRFREMLRRHGKAFAFEPHEI